VYTHIRRVAGIGRAMVDDSTGSRAGRDAVNNPGGRTSPPSDYGAGMVRWRSGTVTTIRRRWRGATELDVALTDGYRMRAVS
jgi:hypothetical protein